MKLLTARKKSIQLNITSLIDVLFLLIIFFAVTSTFLEQPGVKLELPKTATKDLQKVEKAVLLITRDGRYYLRNKEVQKANLPALIRDAMKNSLDKSLIISADKRVEHGVVVEIMDMARQNGVVKLVIATEPKQNGK